jgi:hypothetical protein
MTRAEWSLVTAPTVGFEALNIQIQGDRVLIASDYHGLTRHIWAGINFLMRYVDGA